MSDDSPFQGQPAYIGRASSKKRLVTIFLVVFLLVIASLGALYLLGSSKNHTVKPPTNPIPTEVIAATPTPATNAAQLSLTPSASTSPAIPVSSLKVTVLNGSGVPGAADKTASALKNAGYTHVTTGNAKTFTYIGITVYVKKHAYLSQIQQDLTSLSTSAKVTASVDSTIPSDIEVIIGK